MNSPSPVESGALSLSLDVSKVANREFKVFDAMGYWYTPEMSRFGIRPLHVVYTNDLWNSKRKKSNKWQYASEYLAAREAHKSAKTKSRAVMVDVQHWPTSLKNDETVRKSTSHYSALYYDLKRAEPNQNFGFFGALPITNYWTQDPSQERLSIWRSKNDRLQNLAEKVDAFYLPGYTRSTHEHRWVTNIKYLIEEARRLDDSKPVYVVLWPQYNARGKSYDRKYINADFWRKQLETVKKYADGIVLYTPHGSKWDAPWPWWNVTKQFMEDLGEYSRKPKVSNSEWKLFDGTRFSEKPEMTQFGFTPIKVIYEMMLWDKPWSEVGPWERPSESLVKKWAHRASRKNSDISMVNIEHWPLKGPNVGMSIDRYSQVYDWLKEAEPGMDFGYYSTVPYKLHWNRYPTVNMMKMIMNNNDGLSPLARKVDAYFLCAYTKSKDKEAWVMNNKYMIKQAHRYNGDKPVYMVLYPRYYNPNKPGIHEDYIDKEFWKLQLKIARKYADGAMIWFPYKSKWKYASQKPWWNPTKNFLEDMGK